MENMRDRTRHGHDQVGTRHWKARLTEDDVRAIRKLAARKGANISAIGRDFGIKPQTAWHIAKRNTWGHVK